MAPPRTSHRRIIVRTPSPSVAGEEPPPAGVCEGADASLAHSRIPEEVVVDVRGERRPDHQGRVEQQALEGPQRALPDQLVTPDHEAPGRLAAEVHVRHVVTDQLDLPRVRDPETTL